MKGSVKLAFIVIILAVLSMVLFGCGRQYCERNYPPIDKDSTSTIERIINDTTYIPLPGDTTYLQMPADCPDQTIIYKEGKANVRVIIKDRILTISRITDKDSIRIISSYKNTSEFKELTKIKEVVRIQSKVPTWAFYSIGVIIVLLLYITRKLWVKIIRI